MASRPPKEGEIHHRQPNDTTPTFGIEVAPPLKKQNDIHIVQPQDGTRSFMGTPDPQQSPCITPSKANEPLISSLGTDPAHARLSALAQQARESGLTPLQQTGAIRDVASHDGPPSGLPHAGSGKAGRSV